MTIATTSLDLRAIARQAMIDRGLVPDFPPEVMQRLQQIAGPARETEPSIRDQRQLVWCSIDNDSSKDLDQLTVAERLPDGRVKVLVAIADVDAVVKQATPIDSHAAFNTTSVYTTAEIFPMLPERLSTDLTSLGEANERLAVVVEMIVSADGTVQESTVYRALVKNQAKLTYNEVTAWLDGKTPPPAKVAKTTGLVEQLQMQDQIAQVMRRLRYQHGALDLDVRQAEVVYSDGHVVGLRDETQNRAQRMIEDFMIAANGASSQFLEAHGCPTLLRIVRSPERWDRIREIAKGFNEQLPDLPNSEALAAFLDRRRQADPARFPDLSLTIVKLIGRGEYVMQLPGTSHPGHFGLAVREYSHSTAPNRRFPDLVTQRLLKAALAAKAVTYSPDELSALATHCTTQEDAARKVERQVRKSAAAQFLSGRIGGVFDSIVTGASNKGTWVRLLNPPVEGRLIGSPTKVEVGDKVKVRLSRVDIARGFIDFVRSDNGY